MPSSCNSCLRLSTLVNFHLPWLEGPENQRQQHNKKRGNCKRSHIDQRQSQDENAGYFDPKSSV